MTQFSLGLGEDTRSGIVGVAAGLVLAAAATIAAQASTLARLTRETARAKYGDAEERVGILGASSRASGTYVDDILE
jgi:hypothetical protein